MRPSISGSTSLRGKNNSLLDGKVNLFLGKLSKQQSSRDKKAMKRKASKEAKMPPGDAEFMKYRDNFDIDNFYDKDPSRCMLRPLVFATETSPPPLEPGEFYRSVVEIPDEKKSKYTRIYMQMGGIAIFPTKIINVAAESVQELAKDWEIGSKETGGPYVGVQLPDFREPIKSADFVAKREVLGCFFKGGMEADLQLPRWMIPNSLIKMIARLLCRMLTAKVWELSNCWDKCALHRLNEERLKKKEEPLLTEKEAAKLLKEKDFSWEFIDRRRTGKMADRYDGLSRRIRKALPVIDGKGKTLTDIGNEQLKTMMSQKYVNKDAV